MDPLIIALLVMISSFMSSFFIIWSYLKPISDSIDNQKVTTQNDDINVQPNDPLSPRPVLTSQPTMSSKIVPNLDHDLSPIPRPLVQSPITIMSQSD